jgi:hypothetical protein
MVGMDGVESGPGGPESHDSMPDFERVWALACEQDIAVARQGLTQLSEPEAMISLRFNPEMKQAYPQLAVAAGRVWEIATGRLLYERVALNDEERAVFRREIVLSVVDPQDEDWRQWLAVVDGVLGGRTFEADTPGTALLTSLHDQRTAARAQAGAEDQLHHKLGESLYAIIAQQLAIGDSETAQRQARRLAHGLASTAVRGAANLPLLPSYGATVYSTSAQLGVSPDHLDGLLEQARQLLAGM